LVLAPYESIKVKKANAKLNNKKAEALAEQRRQKSAIGAQAKTGGRPQAKIKKQRNLNVAPTAQTNQEPYQMLAAATPDQNLPNGPNTPARVILGDNIVPVQSQASFGGDLYAPPPFLTSKEKKQIRNRHTTQDTRKSFGEAARTLMTTANGAAAIDINRSNSLELTQGNIHHGQVMRGAPHASNFQVNHFQPSVDPELPHNTVDQLLLNGTQVNGFQAIQRDVLVDPALPQYFPDQGQSVANTTPSNDFQLDFPDCNLHDNAFDNYDFGQDISLFNVDEHDLNVNDFDPYPAASNEDPVALNNNLVATNEN
jgi:hypothetical protein